MRYCADTWYILRLFGKDEEALKILDNTKYGKDVLVIPVIVVSESVKKLLQRGIPERLLDDFFASMDISDKIEVIFLDEAIAKEAAKISIRYSMPLVDSLIAATARLTKCHMLLTDDRHFRALGKKRYLKVKSW